MFFDIESSCLDTKLFTIDNNLNELATSLYEAESEYHIITESVAKSARSTFKEIIATIISWFMSLKTQITTSINQKVREKQMANAIKKMKEEVINNPNEKVTVTNIWYIEETFSKASDDLRSYINGYYSGKVNIKSTNDVDKYITAFYEKLDKWDKALEVASKEKTTVAKSKMLKTLNDELSGKSKIYDSINKSIKSLEQLQSDINIIEKRVNIAGDSVVPEHTSFLQRTIGSFRKMLVRFASFVKKWVVKVMSICIFAFA